MAKSRVDTFELILLIVGLAAGILGFQLINRVYIEEGGVSWLMIIAIFNWLILLILFISLSLTVDLSKKQYGEVKRIIDLLEKKNKK